MRLLTWILSLVRLVMYVIGETNIHVRKVAAGEVNGCTTRNGDLHFKQLGYGLRSNKGQHFGLYLTLDK